MHSLPQHKYTELKMAEQEIFIKLSIMLEA
jgi:hypothetical protein